ncbi:hypothetical protein I314_06479 [Cryptococcus bacillisporus CA1873]|uniref:Uncharacterized protein n=2 Tax=Cryptococcus gattii TaxID=552467 RepID=A0A0D0VBV4_CRYGA|nr:hypothetical protein I312_05806 [Cryptococcus bacillisporus CA1280]KIR57760.1 hypothetical protein I314_06479 [Cryptococcus bacillisporus CA1873]|eukprot:KIR57760.1 hypothetical protein I314_06479 [Cryptococcus gattii CA1873]
MILPGPVIVMIVVQEQEIVKVLLRYRGWAWLTCWANSTFFQIQPLACTSSINHQTPRPSTFRKHPTYTGCSSRVTSLYKPTSHPISSSLQPLHPPTLSWLSRISHGNRSSAPPTSTTQLPNSNSAKCTNTPISAACMILPLVLLGTRLQAKTGIWKQIWH